MKGRKIGHIVSLKTRERISQSLKGNIPWNKGISGIFKHSDETKRKMSELHKGNKVNLGRIHSEETKKKIGLKSKGHKCSEAGKKKLSIIHKGEKNNNWHGGISFEPYSADWTAGLKRITRKRDNYSCQICNNDALAVHHIDYNKKNSDLDNLVTLCPECHIKTNYNRNYWTQYFKKGLNRCHNHRLI